MAKYEELLAEELKKKSTGITTEGINLAGGTHVSDQHVGKSDEWLEKRSNRIKDDATSFYESDGVEKVIIEMMTDKYSVKMITDWLLIEDYEPRREEIEIFDPKDKNFGRGYSYERKEFFDSSVAKVILEFHGYKEYRNPVTELPFDVVTVYPIDPEL